MSKEPTFFIAGTMRGNLKDCSFVDQTYRNRIRNKINCCYPKAKIIDPYDSCDTEASNEISFGQQHVIYGREIRQAKSADIVVAYISEASMGTAIEIWAAYNAGKPVLIISPLIHNWTVKFLHDRLFKSLEDFEMVTNPFEDLL